MDRDRYNCLSISSADSEDSIHSHSLLFFSPSQVSLRFQPGGNSQQRDEQQDIREECRLSGEPEETLTNAYL